MSFNRFDDYYRGQNNNDYYGGQNRFQRSHYRWRSNRFHNDYYGNRRPVSRRPISRRPMTRRPMSRRPLRRRTMTPRENPYQRFIRETLAYTRQHPVVARSIYFGIERQQHEMGYQLHRSQSAQPRASRAPRTPTNPPRQQAPQRNGFNKKHPYYAHLYVSKAWVAQNPKSQKYYVYLVARRRRDINPDAKLAGADVFNHTSKDGTPLHSQPVSGDSFNRIRKANGLGPLTQKQLSMHNGHLLASTVDGLAFDAHVFKNFNKKKGQYWQNPYLISVKSIKQPSGVQHFNPKTEKALNQQAYEAKKSQEAKHQKQTSDQAGPNNDNGNKKTNDKSKDANKNFNPFAPRKNQAQGDDLQA